MVSKSNDEQIQNYSKMRPNDIKYPFVNKYDDDYWYDDRKMYSRNYENAKSLENLNRKQNRLNKVNQPKSGLTSSEHNYYDKRNGYFAQKQTNQYQQQPYSNFFNKKYSSQYINGRPPPAPTLIKAQIPLNNHYSSANILNSRRLIDDLDSPKPIDSIDHRLDLHQQQLPITPVFIPNPVPPLNEIDPNRIMTPNPNQQQYLVNDLRAVSNDTNVIRPPSTNSIQK